MIRLILAYKWTIGTFLVLAALITWAVWQGDWHRLIWAAVYGVAVAVQVAAPGLCRWWGNKRGGSHGRR